MTDERRCPLCANTILQEATWCRHCKRDIREPQEKHPSALIGLLECVVGEYTQKDMFERALRNAKPRDCGEAPRWVAVMDTFALGSTYAHMLCRNFGLDPDEMVAGARCVACEP